VIVTKEPRLETASLEAPLAIVCGGGSLPFAIADAVTRRGRPIVLFALRGFADAQRVALYRHHWLSLGKYGLLVRTARKEGCQDIILIGSVVRPALSQVRLDFATVRHLPELMRIFRGGDNHLLSGVVRALEQDGLRVLGAQEVAPEILVPEGLLGAHVPSTRDRDDIARGLALIATMGPFDVGQAAVVANNHVLAIEAIEGTDEMLLRIAELRRRGRLRTHQGSGVLIKAPKPGQDKRVDLPTIGPHTIDAVIRAGLAGLAVVAGETIVAEPDRAVMAADQAGLFVVGVPAPGSSR